MEAVINVICLVVGIAIGSGLTILGFVTGFKASYEIRHCAEDDNKGLFVERKDPPEKELMDE